MLERLLWTRPRIEAALSELDKNRLALPKLSLARLFPAFDTTPVTIDEVPGSAHAEAALPDACLAGDNLFPDPWTTDASRG